jgi:hypothetical protein
VRSLENVAASHPSPWRIATPGDYAACPGSCRKPPGARYPINGKERGNLLFACPLWTRKPLENRRRRGPIRSPVRHSNPAAEPSGSSPLHSNTVESAPMPIRRNAPSGVEACPVTSTVTRAQDAADSSASRAITYCEHRRPCRTEPMPRHLWDPGSSPCSPNSGRITRYPELSRAPRRARDISRLGARRGQRVGGALESI